MLLINGFERRMTCRPARQWHESFGGGRAEEYDVIEARLGPFEVYVRYADCADLVLRCADSEVLWNESIRDDFGPIENYSETERTE
jgi:hypothetical protein